MSTGFPLRRLDELALSVDYGVTASASIAKVGPQFLRITDIQDDRVDWKTVPFCEASAADEEGARLEGGDIVFARTGATTGKSFLIRACPERAVFASYLIRVRPNLREVEPRYLAWYFQTPHYWRQITSSASGTAQPGVNATKLKALSVPRPPLDEQGRIADILDKANAIRCKRQETITLTEELLRSTFLDMFGDPVTNPKRWPVKTLGEVLDHLDAGWSANGDARPRTEDEYGVLKVSAVTSGIFRPDEHKAVSASAIDRELITPRRGDLLFSRANTRELVAATCLVERDEPRLFLPDKLWRVVPRVDVATAPYLRFLLAHHRFRSELTKTATGTSGSMLNVSMEKLRGLRGPFPSIDQQKKFAALVWRSLDAKAKHKAAHETTETLFRALVSRAFSGSLGAPC